MDKDYDVIVVGAGPGGSTAARLCAQAGLRTLVIEKERLPRYKPCGGCLSLKAVRLLGFDLTSVVENTIYGAKFTYCFNDPFFIQSSEPIAFMVMRDRFDQFLLEKALEKGTEIWEGQKVTRVDEKDGGVEVQLAEKQRVRCQYLVGADGPGSNVARSISLTPKKGEGVGVAVQSEVAFEFASGFPREDLHLIHLDFGAIPNGYGWVFPKRELLSIGIGGMFKKVKKRNPHQYFSSFLKGLNYVSEEKVTQVIGHPLPPFYDEKQRVSQGRIFLVGDACHLMDPLMGEGIYYAIQSGMLAADAIIQSKEEDLSPSQVYQNAVRLSIFDHLKWALIFSRFVFRHTRLAYRALKQYPELGSLYLHVLEGRETYQSFVREVKDRMTHLLKGRLHEKIKKAMARI